jgi:ABC-2 type transport system permease protein
VTTKQNVARQIALGSKTPLGETLNVGAFDVEPGYAGYDSSKVIAVQKRRIHSGVQTISLTVSRPPKFAGVDPFNELIDRNSEVTITKVESR